MSFEEEPESQIDFPLHQYTSERDSPPLFDRGAHGHAHYGPSPALNSDELGSDDTVSDDNLAPISSPISQFGVLKGQVEETQFVPVEHDTQPSMDYDISPITRRVLDNTESSSASLLPPVMAMPLLERRDTPILSDSPEFRFGKPPKPNSMKLTRALPGPNRPHQKEATDREILIPPKSSLPVADRGMVPPATETEKKLTILSAAPSTTLRTLPSHGGPPKGTFGLEEQLNSTLPATQTKLTHLLDQATAHNNENAEVGGSRSLRQTIEHVSGARRILEEASPR